MTVPPIHEWWPHLSIEARHEVLGSGTPLLGERARAEIREITGAVVGSAEELTERDLDYARTQMEAVD